MLSRTVNTNIFKNLIFVTQNKRPKARTKIFELITGSSNSCFFRCCEELHCRVVNNS